MDYEHNRKEFNSDTSETMERNQYKRHTKVNGKEPHFIERGKYEHI
jgi:hypothetical protein